MEAMVIRFLALRLAPSRILAICSMLFLLFASGCAVAPKPSDFVELGTRLIGSGAREDLQRTSPRAANLGPYTVPSDRVLVITSVKIVPDNPGPGTVKIDLLQKDPSIDAIRRFWVFPADRPTQFDILDSGIVVAPGFALSIRDAGGSAVAFRAYVFGYEARAN